MTESGSDPARPDAKRTYMAETYHLALTQESLQMNWSNWRKKRHSPYSTVPPPNSRIVRWTNQVEVRCERCQRRIGRIVAFRSDDLYGIVEDTAKWTLEKSGARPAVLTGEDGKHPPWLWIEGDPPDATAHFRCPSCREPVLRNAHRVGQEIVSEELRDIAIG